MRVLGIIPARGGSVGIKNKNIKKLNGKPLIQYTIEQSKKSKLLTKTIVSTDSEKISKIAHSFGANIPFKRPKNLSTSSASSVDVIKHCLEFFQKKDEYFDAICLLQPTSPYRPKNSIDDAIKKFILSKKDSLISIRKIPEHYNPNWIFKEDNGFLKRYENKPMISRRQDLQSLYHRDGAIYITKSELILKKRKLVSEFSVGFEIKSPILINIDNIDDWRNAEKFINRLK